MTTKKLEAPNKSVTCYLVSKNDIETRYRIRQNVCSHVVGVFLPLSWSMVFLYFRVGGIVLYCHKPTLGGG